MHISKYYFPPCLPTFLTTVSLFFWTTHKPYKLLILVRICSVLLDPRAFLSSSYHLPDLSQLVFLHYGILFQQLKQPHCPLSLKDVSWFGHLAVLVPRSPQKLSSNGSVVSTRFFLYAMLLPTSKLYTLGTDGTWYAWRSFSLNRLVQQ